MLVVAYTTASVREVRFPSLRTIRGTDPTSPNEMVENIGDIRSEPRPTTLIECDTLSA